MTPHTAAAAQLTLDPATTDATLATIFGALRRGPEHTPTQHQTFHEAGVIMIATLGPRDPTQAAYATRAAAAHYGSMECFRRAAMPDVPDNLAIRWTSKAMALSRMNTEMVRTLKQCQAEAASAQPQQQPAARPALSRPPTPATRPANTAPAKPSSTQARPGAFDPVDLMPSERTPPTPTVSAGPPRPAAPTPPTPPEAARPAAAHSPSPTNKPNSRPEQPSSPQPIAAAVATQVAAALAAKPIGKHDPMSSERPSFTPSACILSTQPAATSFLSAPPRRQSLRARLLGSAAEVAPVLAAATTRINLPSGA